MKQSTEDENDESRQYLLSLLPSMKMMDNKEQCMFRMAVQQTIFDILHKV